MSIDVVVAGSAGRMGREVLEAVLAAQDMRLAGALEVAGSAQIGRDAAEFLGKASGVLVSDDIERTLGRANCLIDFTRPEGTLKHVDACVRHRVAMIIGTTGFSAAQRKLVDAASAHIPVLVAPNMAVGVNAVFKLAEIAAGILGDDYDVEIIEAHHRHKVDAPSGTALRLGEVIARKLGRDFESSAVHGRKGLTGERTPGSIGFHAIRGGDIVGEHTVIFAGTGERVEITVRSASRATYALGAVRACRFLSGKPAGLYDMQDVLGLR